ncbi:MAG: S-layer protein domain-containing protein, partial [Euryarchaeota archaeon]|nr:S-layer protein domain-containing protein [Euryarchaeota archaeon]
MAFAATAMATDPVITSWSNDVTNNDSLNFAVDEFRAVQFSATAEPSSVTWSWSVDEVVQTGSTNTFTETWNDGGSSHEVSVTAKNGTNISNPVKWTIAVTEIPPAQVQDMGSSDITASTVKLSWSANSESDLTGYRVYNNGTKIYDILEPTTDCSVTGLSPDTTYKFDVSAYDDASLYGENGSITVKTMGGGSSSGAPRIDSFDPSSTHVSDTEGESRDFSIVVNQTVTVKWYINGSEISSGSCDAGDTCEYSNSSAEVGYWNVSAVATNLNGTDMQTWWWTVTASGHSTGFRIWDANREPPMDLDYMWDARSYTGFYYDIDDDISTETLTIQLDGYTERNIKEGNLQYITTAADLEFEYNEGTADERWGSYKVIGFMAEKYFAGYEDKNTSIATENIRLLSKDMLSKVLIDEDEKHMISTGASLKLKEEYELKIIQLDIDGGQAQIDLMKGGKSVDSDIVTSPDTYVYTEDIGKLDDVPLVAVHIDNVFA